MKIIDLQTGEIRPLDTSKLSKARVAYLKKQLHIINDEDNTHHNRK